jgi:hypothetical protein
MKLTQADERGYARWMRRRARSLCGRRHSGIVNRGINHLSWQADNQHICCNYCNIHFLSYFLRASSFFSHRLIALVREQANIKIKYATIYRKGGEERIHACCVRVCFRSPPTSKPKKIDDPQTASWYRGSSKKIANEEKRLRSTASENPLAQQSESKRLLKIFLLGDPWCVYSDYPIVLLSFFSHLEFVWPKKRSALGKHESQFNSAT